MARGREGAAGRTGCAGSASWGGLGGMSKLQTEDAVCPEQGLAQDWPRVMGWELLSVGFRERQSPAGPLLGGGRGGCCRPGAPALC